MTTLQAFCRADKAALDRFTWLVTHTTATPRAAATDPYVQMHRREAGRYWRRLPATVRAAVLNPDRGGLDP